MKRILFLALLALGGCTQEQDNAWLGYGEGDYAFVSAPQGGWVTDLSVERGQIAHKGDLLFTLDNTQQAASRDQAQASLAEARASLAQEEANLDYSNLELTRQNGLARANAGTPANRDQAENNARQSKARIDQLSAQIGQMQASLRGSDYALSQRRIISQTEGPVEDVYFRPGEYVAPNSSVVSILPPQNIYVRFFVPETDLAKVRLGQKVRITCDGCTPLEATVTFIASQQEYTPPVIFSIGNREKLVFKMEARATSGLPIHPGQPVEVSPL